MLKKLKIIIIFAALSITLCLMSNTYSRYVASSQNDIDVTLARWQILLNNSDITNGASNQVNFTPVIVANNNVAAGKVAPSSTGYFDIEIDPRNVDVSFTYEITLGINNNDLTDIKINSYAILPFTYVEGDAITQNSINNGIIQNTLNYQNGFSKFTIRVFFTWIEGIGESLNDANDTLIGEQAAESNSSFTISADITFEQVI